jgi:PAS domain S-box-containing protein
VRANLFATLRSIETGEYDLLTMRNARLSRTVSIGRWISLTGFVASIALILFSISLMRSEGRRRKRAREELAASEERLRDFIDSASDLIQSSNPEGRMIYANNSFLDTLGYTREEVIGQSSEMFIAPEEIEHCRELFRRIMAGETITDIETVYLRKDGRRVNVVGSSNSRVENGRPVATRTILHDVTRQREVERMKEEFVSIVSHELRTPLTSIRGALGLLGSGMLGDVGERGKRMLDVAITNTDRLVRLINDILDVERIDSGEVPMTRRRVSLTDIIMQTEQCVRPLADKQRIALDVACIDVDLEADADRMIQTLTNLMSNAIKFSPPGSNVRLDAVREIEHVHIRVHDEGRGIPADMLESIFVRFQQVDASDSREKGGSGLGLAISRSIIEQHDGEIWAESTLNRGSTFHVRLPILQPVGARSAVPSSSAAPLILICDDDEEICMVLDSVLTERGYRVVTTSNGADALAVAVEHHPAVVLLDLIMPGTLDGWATMAAMKEHPDTRDIPIIIVSGSTSDVRLSQTVSPNGAERALRKPVEAGSLVHAIENALTQWGRGANVLVVEDDDDLARILVEFLRRHGLHPVHATDGRQAVKLSQVVAPSLIILDIMLPDTDGFAVVDWLRQHDRLRDVPIMVYTAHDLDAEQRARLDIAPELLFTKSRTAPQDLVKRVAAMIGRMTWDQEQTQA